MESSQNDEHYSLSPRWTARSVNKFLLLQSEKTELKISTTRDPDELVSVLTGPKFDRRQLYEPLFHELARRQILVKQSHTDVPGHMGRQAIYWSAFQRTTGNRHIIQELASKHVIIVGLGGIGSIVAQVMAGGGVKHFTFVDQDVVEYSNFNRQYLYEGAHVGLPKVDAARSALISRYEGIDIEAIESNYPQFNITDCIERNADFIVAAFDGPTLTAPLDLLQDAWDAGIPSAFAATGFDKTYASPIFDSSYSPNSPSQALTTTPQTQDRTPAKASSGANNLYVSAFLAEQMLFHLAGLHEEVDYTHVNITQRIEGYPEVQKRQRLAL